MEQDKPWQEVKIDNWKQFDEKIEELGYHEWLFRGHSDYEWEVRTSLDRLFDDLQLIIKKSKGKYRKFAKRTHEDLLIQAFQRNANLYINILPTESEKLEWLAIMQHFGAPTRLLDVTLSPYIAVYFALESGAGDCCVFAINHQEIKKNNETVFGKKTYGELHENIFMEDSERFIIAFQPKFSNIRSVAQQGLFLVPNKIDQSFEGILNDYVQFTENDLCYKYIIPAKLRYEGIEKLRRMNITSATLFHGIDGFCKSLRYQVLERTQSQKLLE